MEKKRNFILGLFVRLKRYSVLLIILFIFLFLFACDHLGTKTGSAIIEDLRSVATTFTPTTDLFDDGSEVSFVSYFFGMNSSKKNTKILFYRPTTSVDISQTEDHLLFDFYGTISSIASGTVSKIGYSPSGEKYIEVEHALGYTSKYVGVQTIGVTSGQSVSAGSPIAVIQNGIPCKVYLYQNGNLIKTSQIVWQD